MSTTDVTIRYFAAVRERLDCESETVELEPEGDEMRVGDLWERLVERHGALEGLRPHVRLARNGSFVDDDATVESGDEIAVIPPVSGGSGTGGRGRYALSRQPIDRESLRSMVARDSAGAIVVFEGTVRDATDGRAVERLEYECYDEMAAAKLREVGAEAEGRDGDLSVAIHHRVGSLSVGETAVVVAVSSPHREAAFEAARFAIDRLKEVVPIWKKEVGPDGEDWVGWGP